jgi:hypothetical protein
MLMLKRRLLLKKKYLCEMYKCQQETILKF